MEIIMGLFSSKPKMQTITQRGGKTFKYMEFVKGYPLPDDVKILENMVSHYGFQTRISPTKAEIREGYISIADYNDILIKYYQLGGDMNKKMLHEILQVSRLIINNGVRPFPYASSSSPLNPELMNNRALGTQMYNELMEHFMNESFDRRPQKKLSLICDYLTQYPDRFDHITGILKKNAYEEITTGKKRDDFYPWSLSATAVLEYLEHDWPAFYEAEFGYLPEGAPETVSGILKKYNLTPAQYYEKAAKGGGGRNSYIPAENVTPACVINEMFKQANKDPYDKNDAIAHFSRLLSRNIEKGKLQADDVLAVSCKYHMFADIGMAAFMRNTYRFPNSGLFNPTRKELEAGFARMMQRLGFPEKAYKSQAMYGELTSSEVYKLADRARDLKFKTKAEKSVLFEPEL